MKYSVESLLKDGMALLVADDGGTLKAAIEKFDVKPAAGMVYELADGVFRRDESAEKERRKEAASLLDSLLDKNK